MDTSHEIDVNRLDPVQRQAFEDVLGAPLQSNQRLFISVSEAGEGTPTAAQRGQTLADWSEAYRGLSEEQIDAIDRDVRTRANLSRNLPQAMDEALLDTDVLSEILKARDVRILDVASRYLAAHRRFAFSAMTFYEIVRGLRANQALRAAQEFRELAAGSDVLPVTTAVLERAADLWAAARQSGHPRNDADLIIAATALESRRVLVTGNVPHFAWISGLSLADWRSERR